MYSIVGDFEEYCRKQKTSPKIPLDKKKKPIMVNNKENPVVELSISEESEESKENDEKEIETGEMDMPDLSQSSYLQKEKETQDKKEDEEITEIDDPIYEKIIKNYSVLNNKEREKAHRINRIKEQEIRQRETKTVRFQGLMGSGLW